VEAVANCPRGNESIGGEKNTVKIGEDDRTYIRLKIKLVNDTKIQGKCPGNPGNSKQFREETRLPGCTPCAKGRIAKVFYIKWVRSRTVPLQSKFKK